MFNKLTKFSVNILQSAWTASATGHHLRTIQTICWKRLFR